MGKIVKFCSSCDEGFAEKFGFCPNCGQTLTPFELNPVVVEEALPPVTNAQPTAAPIEPEMVIEAAPMADSVEVNDEPVVEEEPVVDEPVTAPAPAFVFSKPIDVDRKPVSLEAEHNAYLADGGYYITVIEEKNNGRRNGLLLGTFGFMIFALMTAMVINLFSKDLEVGSINDDLFNAMLLDDVPTVVDE